MRTPKAIALFAFLVVGVTASAQVTEPTPVALPSLSIEGSRLDVAVTYDAARRVYRYMYTIVAAPTNKGNILGFSVDVSGRTEHLPQIDPELQHNARRSTKGRQLQPNTTLPVGIVVPNPARTFAVVNVKGEVSVSLWEAGDSVQPGQTASGFVVESKFPPGLRKAVLDVDDSSWQTFSEKFPPGTLFDDQANYDVALTAVGPSEPDEAALYSGGGQQPAEVNKFLRYSQPTDNRIKVAAGTSSYSVIVYYGTTIDPSTFEAKLNGAVITSQFQPIPGSAQVVTIPIGPGTTKLQLSVVGAKASGGKGTDSDTLTFLPQ